MTQALLVVGIPRSGTTWVAHLLAKAGDAAYLEEPDNHFRRPYAFRAKRRLGRGEYPAVTPGESPGDYETLWGQAFATGGPSWLAAARRRAGNRLLASTSAPDISAAIAGRSTLSPRLRLLEWLATPEAVRASDLLVVKSVYAPLALEWIADRFSPQVLVVIRHPLNVVSSWRSMGWLDRAQHDMLDELDPGARQGLADTLGVDVPAHDASPLRRAGWLAGALTTALATTARRQPAWSLVSHELLCARPHERFPRLASELGLEWRPTDDDELDRLDRPGTGYEIRRVAGELGDVWRRRLDDEEACEVQKVLELFDDGDWTPEALGCGTP